MSLPDEDGSSDSSPAKGSGVRHSRPGAESKAALRLVAELTSAPPRELDASTARFLGGLIALFDAAASWICVARRDERAVIGWRPVRVLFAGRERGRRHVLERWFNEEDYKSAPSVRHAVSGAGSVRVIHNRRRLGDEQWRETLEARTLRERGLRDRIIAAHPVGPDCEVFFGVDRCESASDFSENDARLADEVVRAVGNLCRWIGLDSGVVAADQPFTAREREVLRHLLTGDSEKQIADALGLKTSSTHQIVVRVFRKLAVHSRAELMALWLGPRSTCDESRGDFGTYP